MGNYMKEVFVSRVESEPVSPGCSPLLLSDFYFLQHVSAAVHVTPCLGLQLGVMDLGAAHSQAVMGFQQAGLISAFLLTLLSAGKLVSFK